MRKVLIIVIFSELAPPQKSQLLIQRVRKTLQSVRWFHKMMRGMMTVAALMKSRFLQI